jgi:hypothetical protein
MLHLETVEHSGKPAWQNYPVTPERAAKVNVLLTFISGFVLYHAIRGELPTPLNPAV